MKKIVILLIILCANFLAYAQPIQVSDPLRGIMVDKFVRMKNRSVNDGTPEIDLENSILGVDANHDMIYEKEVQLINYCNQNHITQLSLYDVKNIFKKWHFDSGNQDKELKVWDEDSQSFQLLRWHLCRFITYAKSHGIREILISVSEKEVANSSTEEFRFSKNEMNNSTFNSSLLSVQNAVNNGNENNELLKLALRSLDFNNSNPCNVKIDGFTYEEEFWNSTKSFQYVSEQLREIYHIKQLFNALHPTDTVLIQMYYSQSTDLISGWVPSEVMDFLDGSPYRGAFFKNNLGIQFPAPHPRIIDRLLNVYYKKEIKSNDYINVFYNPDRINDERSVYNFSSTNVIPLFSTESRVDGGAVELLGNWLVDNPSQASSDYNSSTVHNIFTLEECLYNGYQTTYDPINYLENNVLPGSAIYFTSSQMVNRLKMPEVFYMNSPIAAAQNNTLLIDYCGPFEKLTYDFKISDQFNTIIYSSLNSSSPIPVATPSDFHYQFAITLQTPLAIGRRYLATMVLHYSNGINYTYQKVFYAYSDNAPHLEIIDDSDVSTPDEDSRCEGDKCFVQLGGNIDGTTEYKMDNGQWLSLPNGLRRISFQSAGIHTIALKTGVKLSETKTISIKRNPSVQIFPDCAGATFSGTLNAISLGDGSLFGNSYLWSTGEKTPSILTLQAEYAAVGEYNVSVTNINGCSRSATYITNYNSTFATPNVICTLTSIVPYNCSYGSATFNFRSSNPEHEYVVFIISANGSQLATFTTSSISPYNYSQTFSRLLPGNYTLYCTDIYRNTECPYKTTFTIPESNPISVTSTITPVVNCATGTDNAINSGVINLNVSVPVNSYLWSNGETTQNISALFPGTYQVKIVDGNSCEHYSTYDVLFDYGAIPEIKYISTSDESCVNGSNGSVHLYSSQLKCPSCMYDMNLSSGQTCTSCNTIQQNSISAGTYQISVIDPSTGCTAKRGYSIGNPTPVTFTASSSISCSNTAEGSIDIAPYGGSGNYVITYSGPLIGTATSNTISNLSPGTYSVNVSDLNCSSNNATQQIIVNGVQCCTPSTINFPPSGTDISTVTTYSGQSISLNGDISILNGGTLQLSGCSLAIAPSRKITVFQGGYLKILSNSVLASCGSELWKGIEIQVGGKLDVINSTIQDAEYGIKGSFATQVTIDNSIFNSNYISIFYPFYNHSPSPIALSLKGSIFKSSYNLKNAYPGQLTYPLTKPYAGIVFNDVPFVDIGAGSTASPNTFENMNSGIQVISTSADISNFKFTNIKKYDNYTYLSGGNGAAIYGNGQGRMYTLKVNGRNNSTSKEFTNCYRGIQAQYMGVISAQNYFENCDIAYFVSQAVNQKISIHHNHIDANIYGIRLYLNRNIDGNEITYNVINGGTRLTTVSGSPSKLWAIKVDENHFNNGLKSIISQNIITLGQYGISGIEMKGANGYLLDHNYLTLSNTQNFDLKGISLSVSNGNTISCNSVAGTNTLMQTTLNGTESAYKFFTSADNRISCNNATNTGFGYSFSGACTNTDFRANDIGNHYTGLFYSGSALTGTQANKGNYWYLQTYYGFAAQDRNPLGVQNDQYLVYNSGPTFPGFSYTNNPDQQQIDPPFIWFQLNSTDDENCGNIRHSDCSLVVGPTDPGNFNDLIKIAQNQINAEEYNSEVIWQAKLNLYNFLLKIPTYLDSSEVLSDYYSNMAGSMIQQIALLDNQNEFQNRASVVGSIADRSLQIYLNSQALTEIDNKLLDAGLSHETLDSLVQVKNNLIESTNALIIYNNAAYHLVDSFVHENLDLLTAKNEDLTGTEDYIQNQKVANEAYINCILRNQPDSLVTYAAGLLAIAQQCPLAGGQAVFLARTLYESIDPFMDYNDQLSCIQSGYSLKTKPKKAELFSLFPNPASNEINLSYQFNQDALFEIINSLNQIIYSKFLDENQNGATIQTLNYSNGFYTFRIIGKSDSVQLTRGKFIVTH